jgi:hypothetical protein
MGDVKGAGVPKSNRSRDEMRTKHRQPLRYSARILTDAIGPPRPCMIADVSATGAHLVLQSDDELAPRFVLLLSATGGARRRCRLVWRSGLNVGAEFVRD